MTVGWIARVAPRNIRDIAVANGLASLLQIAIGIVSARALAAEGRGTLAVLLALAGIGAQLGAFGLDVVFGRIAGRNERDREELVRLVLTYGLLLCVTTALAFLAINIGFADRSLSDFSAALGVFIGTSVASILLQAILLGAGRFSTFAYVRIVLPATVLPCYVLLWTAEVRDVRAYLMVYAICNLVLVIRLAWTMTRPKDWLRIGRATVVLPNLLRVHGREIIAAATGNLLRAAETSMPVLIVGWAAGPAAAGLFAVATVAVSFQGLIADAYARHAFASAASASGRSALDLRSVWMAQLVAGVISAPIAYSFLPWVYGEEFAQARGLVPIMVLAALLSSVASVLAERLRGLGMAEKLLLPRLFGLGLVSLAPFISGTAGAANAVALAQGIAGLSQVFAFRRSLARTQRLLAGVFAPAQSHSSMGDCPP